MPSELLLWLLRGAAATTLAIVIVLSLRGLWLRWLGAQSLLWLWLLVPAVLIAVSLPARTVQVMATQRVEPSAAALSLLPLDQQRALHDDTRRQVPGAITSLQDFVVTHRDNLERALAGTWLSGALLLALHLAAQQRRFRRRLGKLQPRRDGSWQAQTSDFGPAAIGLLRPRIVVPADFEQRYDPRQRQLILAHEGCHLRRGDLQVNFLLCIMRCMHWFNPALHLAARRLRFDQELACDAAVLQHFPRARRAYADAILNTQLADLGLPVGCYWQSSHPLKWRIIMLTKPNAPLARVVLGNVLAIAGSTFAAVAAWAALPERVEVRPVIAEAGQPVASAVTVNAAAPAGHAAPAVAASADARPARAGEPTSATPGVEATPAVEASPAVEATPAVEVTPVVETVPVVAQTPVAEPKLKATPVAHVRPALAMLDNGTAVTVEAMVVGDLHTSVQAAASVEASTPISSEVADEITLPVLLQAERPRFPGLGGKKLPSDGGGQVIVAVSLDEHGEVVDARVASSTLGAPFQRSALRAAKKSRYAPATKNGVAVSCTAMVPVVFAPDAPGDNDNAVAQAITPPQMFKPQGLGLARIRGY